MQSIRSVSRRFGRVYDILWVIGGQAAQSLASFLTGLALGRWVSQEALGAYALGYTFCFLIISLGDTLIATPYTYFRARQEGEQAQLFPAALLGTLLLGLVVALGLTLFHVLGTGILAELWPALPVAVFCLVLREFLRRHFYVIGRSVSALLLDLLTAAGQLVLLGWLLASDRLNANNVFWTIGAVSGIAFVVFLSMVQERFVAIGPGTLCKSLRDFFGYGAWLVGGGLCHVASVQLYPWLALLGGGQGQTGLYAACVALTNLINPLLIALTNYFRPRFIAHYKEAQGHDFVAYVFRRALLFLIPALVLLLVVTFEGGTLLRQLYGEPFTAGAPALVFLALGLLAVACAAPVQLGLLALRAPVSNVFYHGSILLVVVVLAYFWRDRLSLVTLAQIYLGSNVAGLLMLLGLLQFFKKNNRGATGESIASS
ncbi:oligosaccharide flippase family protein [Pseudomonas sp. ANT_H14]|uniref:lipopolysaccharide biosynthesis protein n=1 Tax=unclassified Pseudomonas TaxID=196821 RepID=UPI0011F090A4|nr:MULTISPECIES: oligosaccharide flippase family protein [unclassified Pseudomonas]KAA0948218.1 oligosaccharide flippase family protein [Pseudomonas sp. ANT_H4]KAA0953017.1 oligosaccharide flippase family protein [Pseudomonas sp. ANT_H14]